MARKRSPQGKKKKPARKPKAATAGDGGEVVDFRAKQIDQAMNRLGALSQAMSSALDSKVALIVGAYREWERANPDLALKPKHKLPMVRLGFVGPGGYQRCHEPDRLPDAAFDDEEVRDDNEASQIVMCPAMEAGRCQGVWRGMKMPPCYLLLLEVHHGLGGGALDDGVQWVVDDWGKWDGPEQRADSFARAERLVQKYDPFEGL